ncbi:hypothetical protein RvY_10724 [Ramazzottius varieornatus]|uniref:ATP-dependent DNA helicase n=1 Tax=Ramazzottius varieornatus TaxID=947166 RepID=A0A1D1VI69_RAMVA|nr:hypothetical protein RvY_10724 [Ramazzottius varieornatus]
MALAWMGPNADANLLQGIEAGQLGRRALDVGHDWEAYGLTLPADQVITGYMIRLKQQEFPQRVQHNFTNPDLLNTDQRKVFELVLRHFERSRHNLPVEQILLIVQGSAGTGKSFLMKALECERNRADNVEYSPTCMRPAPTIVATCNIRRRTVHSALRLPIRSTQLQPLNGKSFRSFQRSFSNTPGRCHLVVPGR